MGGFLAAAWVGLGMVVYARFGFGWAMAMFVPGLLAGIWMLTAFRRRYGRPMTHDDVGPFLDSLVKRRR